jgi:hypothetical protein
MDTCKECNRHVEPNREFCSEKHRLEHHASRGIRRDSRTINAHELRNSHKLA